MRTDEELLWQLDNYNTPDRTNDDQRQIAVDIHEAKDRIRALSCEGERKDAVIEAADRLYKQLHNIREARPRWANESVCMAMVELGKELGRVSEGNISK